MVRLPRELEAEARALAGPKGFSAAVAEGLRWWVAREKRKAASPTPLAKHLVPPTDRETAARKGRTA